jgi:16S rRNA (adenine1518-N6/adenine1519-N6)-dimethyltransferase
MSELRQRVIAELAAAGLAPLHRLGQNFMVDAGALTGLTTALGAAPGQRVVEIGPGTGLLTERLLEAGCTVLAVELDRGLHALLQAALVPRGLQLVHGDCLASKSVLHPAIAAFAAAGPWRLGANLPYDVALPALLNAVALPNPPEAVAVTVQWEAAERLCAKPGDDAWGASAAVLQAAGVPRLVRRLPPQCFHPRPRVDSAILAWTPRAALPAGFGRWCRAVFSARRKVLPGALRDAGVTREQAVQACAACGLDTQRRLEALSAAELLALYAALGPAAVPPLQGAADDS